MRIVRNLFAISLVFGLSACGIFSGDGKSQPFESRATVMGVNGYLWQAALDTLAFMPITSAEQSNGLILTDWYVAPDNANERVKVTVRFLSNELRSDAVRVIVTRQMKQNDTWVATSVQASTPLQIEESILVQARRLRIDAGN